MARAIGTLGALALATASCAAAAPAPAPARSQTPTEVASPVPTTSLASPSSSPSVRPSSAPLALEACGDVTHFPDGSVLPVLCPDGRPSAAADGFFRSLEPALAVLRLSSDANLTDVETAMCADRTFAHVTNPREESAYRLAAAEQGWGFGDEPPAWLLRQPC